MNKKILAVLMASCTLFSMAACNGKGGFEPFASTTMPTTATQATVPSESETTTELTEETTTEETTEETSEETSESKAAPEESTSASKVTETDPTETSETTAKPTAKPIGKTTVTNAYKRTFSVTGYGKFTTKYPKVTIKGVSTTAINKEISKKFSSIAKKNDSVVSYSYYIGKKYVSIIVAVQLDAGKEGSEKYVYNVSRETGKKLTKSQMLKLIGVSSSSFNSKVKASVKKYWNNNILKSDKSAATKKMYNTAIASKSINSAVPYMNTKGKKCFLIRKMKTPGQSVNIDFSSTY